MRLSAARAHIAGAVETVGREILAALDLVQARRQRITAHLDLASLAFADRIALFVHPHLETVGNVIQRRAQRIARHRTTSP